MDAVKKRQALRSLTNGVYILTSRNGDRYGGATVTWVSQASFKPPLVMAAVRRSSNAYQCLLQSKRAVIHLLSSSQQNVAQRFFRPTQVLDGKLNGETFFESAAPILTSAPAYLDCAARQIIDGEGDHAIVILEVVDAEFRERFEPLTIHASPWEYGG